MTPITYETVLQWADYEAGPICMDKDYQKARRLLEAAPDLLEALHLLVVAIDKDGLSTKFQRFLSKADYAIAKAIGE